MASPDRLLQSKEAARMVSRLVAQLPHKHRAALLLKEAQGLTYVEIAEVLRIPVGTAQIRVHRGRLEVREGLRRLGLRSGGSG